MLPPTAVILQCVYLGFSQPVSVPRLSRFLETLAVFVHMHLKGSLASRAVNLADTGNHSVAQVFIPLLHQYLGDPPIRIREVVRTVVRIPIPILISPDPQLVIPAKAGIQSLLLLDIAKSRSQSLDSRQKHAGMTSQSHSSPSVQLRIEANQVPISNPESPRAACIKP